jgi:putative hemolysin
MSRKELIPKDAFIKATNLNKYHMEMVADMLMDFMKLSKANQVYDELYDLKGLDFIQAFLDVLQVRAEISREELQRLPAQGSFVVVSNHPFGAIDGLMMVLLLAKERPDVRVMVNFLLSRIETIAEYFIGVNPLETQQQVQSSLGGMKAALKHLQEGKPLGIFPAGEVSSYQSGTKHISDREWQISAIKLIKKAQVPVVPMYFQGSNSKIFHLLGKIHPLLRTATLSREMFAKKGEEIKVRIGHPIPVKDIAQFEDPYRLGRFLRAKTYALGSALQVKKFYFPNFRFPSKPQPIAQPIATDILAAEVETLRAQNRLFVQQNYEIFIATAVEIPNLLHEIGRLREITFRNVGEGTNKHEDLDEYDLYYHHLFIWDKDEQKVVGAYRMGKGSYILNRYGKKGFYLNTLFKIKGEMISRLSQAIELGRSFITQEYQQKRLPLFLLWKGILFFLLNNPEYRYLIGPVSISNAYSKVSRSLLVHFIQKHYFDYDLAAHVKPRKQFKPDFNHLDTEGLIETITDLSKLDKILADIEPMGFTVPVLLKKYIQQNAKIIAFNVDPKFNDALDGLMILDITQVPPSTIENLRKEMEI